MIRYVNVTSVKERGLVNESLGTTAVIQAHVFLARKEEARSGALRRSDSLEGHGCHTRDARTLRRRWGEGVPQRLPAANSNKPQFKPHQAARTHAVSCEEGTGLALGKMGPSGTSRATCPHHW